MKQGLKVKYYIRYCDDFVVLHEDQWYLESLIPKIGDFLKIRLKMSLHPNKVVIRKYRQGVDFLGYVSFPSHTIMRLKTKKRMIKKLRFRMDELKSGIITQEYFNQCWHSYSGVLSHCNAYELREYCINLIKNCEPGSSIRNSKKGA